MVDPVFKAPLPPLQTNENLSDQTPAVSPAPTSEQSSEDAVSPDVADAAQETRPSKKQQIMQRLEELKTRMIRYFWYSMTGLFLLGAFFGCSMSGSDSAPKPTQSVTGISARVIPNRDKKERMPICGSVSPSQACLFYVLNGAGYDKVADDFFKDVAATTRRSEFNLRRDNPLYAKTPIKPGYFAEIIVPAI